MVWWHVFLPARVECKGQDALFGDAEAIAKRDGIDYDAVVRPDLVEAFSAHMKGECDPALSKKLEGIELTHSEKVALNKKQVELQYYAKSVMAHEARARMYGRDLEDDNHVKQLDFARLKGMKTRAHLEDTFHLFQNPYETARQELRGEIIRISPWQVAPVDHSDDSFWQDEKSGGSTLARFNLDNGLAMRARFGRAGFFTNTSDDHWVQVLDLHRYETADEFQSDLEIQEKHKAARRIPMYIQ
eukprot:CAMPEP_0177638634 /NCGR_PEP_ID=MMETSP0447-20121125/5595_1 /TAXON_ID=0 /ORGANISM="Stygamoeba regulata, Strain BSH-02190019" /LENGTH=243 /DNA_ID=CAMNT_0019140613 /DNA_START=23 /DNA_END=754 /DNA_ORIENTATION=-